jgi:excisionase family DNA binding protein
VSIVANRKEVTVLQERSWEYAEPQHRVFFYSVKAVAHALGISTSSVYEHIAKGDINVRKYGRKTLVPEAEVEKLAGMIDSETAVDSR